LSSGVRTGGECREGERENQETDTHALSVQLRRRVLHRPVVTDSADCETERATGLNQS